MLQINVSPERTRIISAVTKEEVSKFVKENGGFEKNFLCIQKLVTKNLDIIDCRVEKRLSQYDLAMASQAISEHFSLGIFEQSEPLRSEIENNSNDLDPLWD